MPVMRESASLVSSVTDEVPETVLCTIQVTLISPITAHSEKPRICDSLCSVAGSDQP
jgi:hypothetical protein